MSNGLTLITNELILDFLEMKYKMNLYKLIPTPIKRMVLFNPHHCDICKSKHNICKQYYLTSFLGCVICKKCSIYKKNTMIMYALSLSHYIIPWQHFISIFNSIYIIDFDTVYKIKRSNGVIEKWKFNFYDDAPWFSDKMIYIPMKSIIQDVGKSITLVDFLQVNNIKNADKILQAFTQIYLKL